ncbi:cuticle protein AM1199-like isoform X2 [Palaemon carinicauda]|uniref:cuticle protein AM1199-like isoform X1 n=1 Tax=Palaemon carinicauda TaxID=392227 RepID=UPI0035B625EB
MKSVILACLAAVAVAAPQFGLPQQQFVQATSPLILPNQVAILRDDRQDLGNGEFAYTFESDNGISESRRGFLGSLGQSNMEGSFRFPLPDGTFAEVRYVADENGFRAESPLIPTPHPLPAHAIEQIRFAEEQRARGITFNDY